MGISVNEWEKLVQYFLDDLKDGVTVSTALEDFIISYAKKENISSYKVDEWDEEQYNEPKKEESRDVYFERKMKPIWDYVYNLQKQYTNLLNRVTELEKASRPFGPANAFGPAYPTQTPPQVPNYYGPAGDPLDWYKVTNHADGNDASKFQTTGYIKVEEPKYTQEEIEAWNNIRFDDPAKR